ncbi:plasmid pRiA4b ORF-3 family protein [Patescibacteria group bacterium]|nr:plasmid pRiA4b ORF-3 family protein [Patescibacteria group bacterium]MBU2460415.1 plasmid pRiA4b ORF-3 family protein [Patescibacteria group bacterium]MBU2544508.1 plasmid pRiA4b ORF-3 family protein [Patescibacteria group bacterium]
MQTYIFKSYVFRTKSVVRNIEVPASTNLYKFAEAIIAAYGFYFDHCFGFFSTIAETRYFDSDRKYELFTDLIEEGDDIEPTGAGSVKKTKVSDVWKNVGEKMLFLFDYGDNWPFVVELIGFGVKDPKAKYPRVVKRVGKAPEQYPDVEE